MASASTASTVFAPNTSSRTRPKVAALQTPVSASYPSEIRSPLPGTPAFLKREEGLKTPITPPHAYLDFLKTMSPVLMSPVPTGTSSHFNFSGIPGGRYMEKAAEEVDDTSATTSATQPPLSRTCSSESAATVMTISTEATDTSSEVSSVSADTPELKREHSPEPGTSSKVRKPVKPLNLSNSKATTSETKAKPESPRIIIPPSPFVKPASAKFPRRAQIPGSPLSPANLRSPMSARSHHEPRSASCLGGTPWSASFPPDEGDCGNKTSKVSVRQVVTRTVTYSQTPLDPAPKGKRRKIED